MSALFKIATAANQIQKTQNVTQRTNIWCGHSSQLFSTQTLCANRLHVVCTQIFTFKDRKAL